MTDPSEIEAAAARIRQAKDLKRAELMLELALETLVEIEGVRPTRRRLLVITQNLKWY